MSCKVNVGGGLLIFVTKCDKGWVGCFWIVLHFLNNLILSTFGLKIASLVLFYNIFGSISKNNLAILV